MHNHVTYRIAQAFRQRDVTTLRFNFRGVGHSTGTYDEGRGELADAKSAFDFLASQAPGVPLYVAGFSFGSRVALQLALEDPRAQGVLAAGLAIDLFDFGFVTRITQPKAFIQAEHDEYGALPEVEAFLRTVPEPKKLFVVPQADHLSSGRLSAFEKVAAEAVDWLLAIDHKPRH
jgi:alpha/beta superfamily hydrolase